MIMFHSDRINTQSTEIQTSSHIGILVSLPPILLLSLLIQLLVGEI